MSEPSKRSKGDVAPPATTRRHYKDPPSLADHRRGQVRGRTEPAVGAGDVLRYLADQAERRPYRSLGIAVAVGYLLGGGFRSRLTAVSLGAAARLAMALATRQLTVWITQGGSTADQKTSS